MKDLVITEEIKPARLFDGKSLDPLLEKIRERALSIVPDTSTAKGRKEIASIAHSVARSKTLLDSAGKELVSGLKEQAKVIDRERRKLRDDLDTLKAEVREPLTRWEQEEESRVQGINDRIAEMRGHASEQDEEGNYFASGALAESLKKVKSIIVDDSFAEFKGDAAEAKDWAVTTLENLIERRRFEEEQAAELERLKKEKEERGRLEREERLRKEGEERARGEAEERARLEAERVERERKEKDDADRRERERIESEKEAAIEAQGEAEQRTREAEEGAKRQVEEAARRERERIEDERRAEKEAAMKREADKNNRASINRAAASAIVSIGLSEEHAKTVVAAIATGKIPYVSIRY